MRAALALLLLLAAPLAAGPTAIPEAPLAQPAEEARAKALMAELRCVTCQNQSVLDSNAPQAEAMRAEVRARVAAGDDSAAIRQWFVERYGDWVRLEPPARADTALLWAAPLLFLGLGAVLLARRIQR
jgi:cytochrome c-type biogenesis protein CcmH